MTKQIIPDNRITKHFNGKLIDDITYPHFSLINSKLKIRDICDLKDISLSLNQQRHKIFFDVPIINLKTEI